MKQETKSLKNKGKKKESDLIFKTFFNSGDGRVKYLHLYHSSKFLEAKHFAKPFRHHGEMSFPFFYLQSISSSFSYIC